MAKSVRSSTRKRNSAALRAKVFGPAQDARTERLSAKLQALITKPKAEQDTVMSVDDKLNGRESDERVAEGGEDVQDEQWMDCDDTGDDAVRRTREKSNKGKIAKGRGKKKKKSHRKAKNSHVFHIGSRARSGPGLVRPQRR